MSKVSGLTFGIACFLAIPALAQNLTLSSAGRGPTEKAAISAAKQQAVDDASTAGLTGAGRYRLDTVHVIRVKRQSAGSYEANIEVELALSSIKGSHALKVLIVALTQDGRVEDKMPLVEQVRRDLRTSHNVDIVTLSGTRLANLPVAVNLNDGAIDALVSALAKSASADVVCLLGDTDAVPRKDNTGVVLLTSAFFKESHKRIRVLRSNISPDSSRNLTLAQSSLSGQIAASIAEEVARLANENDIKNLVTVRVHDPRLQIGQSVVVTAETLRSDSQQSEKIVTRGIVKEIRQHSVLVSTTKALEIGPTTKIRFEPTQSRGVVITEQDW